MISTSENVVPCVLKKGQVLSFSVTLAGASCRVLSTAAAMIQGSCCTFQGKSCKDKALARELHISYACFLGGRVCRGKIAHGGQLLIPSNP